MIRWLHRLLFRLTIAQRIGAAFLVIALAGAASLTVTAAGLQSVRDEFDVVTDEAQPFVETAYELEINLFEVSSGVFRYMDTGREEARRIAEANMSEFREFMARFERQARSDRELRLGSELKGDFTELASIGETMMSSRDRLRLLLTQMLDEAATLTDVARGLAGASENGAAEIQSDLARITGALARLSRFSEARYRRALSGALSDLQGHVEDLEASSSSANEAPIEEVIVLARRLIGQGRAYLLNDRVVEERTLMFTELRGNMNATLDSELQPLAAQRYEASRAAVRSTSARARLLAFILVALLLVVGGFVAFVVVAGINASLRSLTAGTQEIAAGRLEHRVQEVGKDELSALARDFNRMAAELGVTREQLEYVAKYDQLTGLANRSMFNDRLQEALARSARSGRSGALLFVDLDGFKAVNDSTGHDAGDLLLKLVAQRLRACVREVDLVSRLGGDEFTLVVEDLNAAEDASLVAEKVVDMLGDPIFLSEIEANVTGSVGVAVFPRDGTDAGALLRKADTAMYYAKAAGRNDYKTYDPSFEAAPAERRRLRVVGGAD